MLDSEGDRECAHSSCLALLPGPAHVSPRVLAVEVPEAEFHLGKVVGTGLETQMG